MITLKNTLLTLLLLAASSLTIWSLLVSKASQPKQFAENLNLPDAFMENVIATIMNKNGTPALIINTPKMIHYPLNNATDIQKPFITIYRESPNPWHVSSEYAKATEGINQILFWENVVIHHDVDKDNPNTVMKTTTLTVFPDKRTAQTDQPITIIQPDVTIHAIGMEANMNDGTIKLLSQAQGEYAPTS